MRDERFEVGDRVFLTTTKHFGTIVRVFIQKPNKAPDAPGVRGYDIQLDTGGTINGMYHGIQRAQR